MIDSSRYEIGEVISLPHGRSYKIAEVLGPAETVHVTAPHENFPAGRFFVVSTYPSQGIDRPVHRGFDDVDTVMRQHQHVVNNLIGTVVIVPESNEYPEEVIQVPGELDRIRAYNLSLGSVAQKLMRTQDPRAIERARADIDRVLKEGLSHPRTLFKRRAKETLLTGRDGSPEQALGATFGAQRLNAKREDDILEQSIATAARFNALVDRDQNWRQTLGNLESRMGESVRDLRHVRPEDVKALLQRMKNPDGVRGMLDDFTGEPYYTPAQKILNELSSARDGGTESYATRLSNLLAEQVGNVRVWRNIRSGQTSQYRIDLDLANVDTSRRIA